MNLHKIRLGCCLWLASLAPAVSFAAAEPVSHLEVHVVTGRSELSAGSVLELRIYESGKPVRRVMLTHGEAWPHDSTRLIPVSLREPLDPGAVSRFAVYYRAASPLTPPWELVAADVELARNGEPYRKLLGATLSGTIAREGELATEEREAAAMLCTTDADCDNHRRCDGAERCRPRSVGADARGCVKGLPVACAVNEVCSEQRGCIGPATIAPK